MTSTDAVTYSPNDVVAIVIQVGNDDALPLHIHTIGQGLDTAVRVAKLNIAARGEHLNPRTLWLPENI